MEGGFFTKEQTASHKITKVPQSCASCGLSKKARKGRMQPWGSGKKKILIIAGSPTESDDRRGKPWTDSRGDLIKWAFRENGINLFRDCITTFACRCPVKGKIDDRQIACCSRYLLPFIDKMKPELIFLVDDAAVKSVIGSRWQKGIGGDDGVMARWRGWVIPDRFHDAWIAPIFSPGYVSYKEDKSGRNLAKVIWLQDIARALNKWKNEARCFVDELQYLTHITNEKLFKEIMKKLMRADLMSFDYESTGIKPHAVGHQITTISACISPDEGYVWDNTPERVKLWRQVLHSKVKKSAHNLGFEDLWSSVIFKADIENWYWDSMINAHIIDNRPGIVGLKFQTYVHFGLMGYGEEIEPYLKASDPKNANSKNQILEFIKKFGAKAVREYCGLDSIYGMMLTLDQIDQINKMK